MQPQPKWLRKTKMREASEVFKSIRYAKLAPKGKPHKSTDDEEHGTVGEKEYEDQVKHVKSVSEEKKDEYDEGEYDREGDMAKSDLRSIIANAQKLHDMIDDADNLPEWVQSKITIAEDYISTVANYMTAEVNEEVKDEYARKVDKYLRKKYKKEEVEYLEEKNAPTNPELWSRAKALARSKFDVYPSAYANGWASKWYKSKGGGWKSVSEEVEQIDEAKDFSKYIMKPTKTEPKIVRKTNPSGRTTDHVEYEVHGTLSSHKKTFKSKKEAEEYFNIVKEDIEQLDEMPGANMDTRAVHQHLKKKGWSITRTSGGHDVFTHPEAKHHIPVPRHRQLKAPLVKGILKQSEVREEVEQVEEGLGKFVAKVINKVTSANKAPLPQKSDRREFETPGKPVKVNESRAKDIAKMAARRNAGLKEQSEPEDSVEKTDTPAKRSLSKTAGIVKDLAKNAKTTKKEKPDTFQAEPELSSQIVKV
jgi:predicted RNA binding protein YcfA (HicA-like mRNA interferase family)